MQQVSSVEVNSLDRHPSYPYATNNAMLQLLVDSIKATGTLIEPIVVNGKNQIISGVLRWLAYKTLGWPSIPAIMRTDIDAEDEEFLIVSSNRQRVKSMSEIQMEIEMLKRHWGKKQGHRSDLDTDEAGKINTRKRIADELGISEGNIQKIQKISELNPTLFALVDKKELSINQAYEQATQKVKPAKASKPGTVPEVIPQHICPSCGCHF